MSKQRLTATDRVRNEIDGLFADPERELGEILEQVARLSVRLMMQSALEAEVTEFLGRERYARGERARAGHRNGYPDIAVKTTAGPVTLERPKLRGTLEKFASRLLGKRVTKTNALESLVICGWVRGLSDRDIEAALAEALGPEATVSKSTVSRICERIKDEFAVWRTRDLSDVELDYLFVDASHFKMHDGARSEPVLVAYSITTTGDPIFVHLDGVDSWQRISMLRKRPSRGRNSSCRSPMTARYAINAANARRLSLYDALYGTDALGRPPPSRHYDPARGERVIAWGRRFLNHVFPLWDASHAEATAYKIRHVALEVELSGGATTSLDGPAKCSGHIGATDNPSAAVVHSHHLPVEIFLGRDYTLVAQIAARCRTSLSRRPSASPWIARIRSRQWTQVTRP